MSGKELKEILREEGVNLSELAKKLGFDNDQRLHSALKAEDVKSGLLEAIAKAIDKGSAIIATIKPATRSFTNCFLL